MPSGFSFDGPGLWYATRATGLVALLLLTFSVVLGVLTAGRFDSSRWPRFVTLGLHRNASLLTVVFLFLHVLTTVVDTYTSISVTAAFVPFSSAYRTFWLGLGAVASDLVLALIATSLVRLRLGYRAWRAIHWLAYVSWPIALGHALGTGTDPGRAWMTVITVLCVTAVIGSVGWRLAAGRPRRRGLRLGIGERS